jgi:hypothetical protein
MQDEVEQSSVVFDLGREDRVRHGNVTARG